MAQQLQSINISAPGFAGINTQDSPISLSPVFAAVANNCVIDKFGRVGARQGFTLETTTTNGHLGTSIGVESIKEYKDSAGVSAIFTAANNKILKGVTTLVDKTPAAYTITANNWQMVNFNDRMYFFQRGYEPLVYIGSTDVLAKMSSVSGAAGTPPQANTAIAAYGRVWCADFAADKHTVYWSDLLNGSIWTGGSSGNIDISEVWPDGYDEIVTMTAHNGFLIIFGKKSILVYAGAEDPATMAIADVINGIGCIARDSVQHTGADILFLDATGVRSLGRTIQEKSVPIGDISKNVRDEIKDLIAISSQPIKCHYSPENAFYLVTFRGSSITYCFDTRRPLEDGSYRATTWTSLVLLCYERTLSGILYIGTSGGVGKYQGYRDNTSPYLMSYFSHPLTFDNPSNLKFLKKVSLITIGGTSSNGILNWAYDYSLAYSKQAFSFVSSLNPANYNISEFNTDAEYTFPTTINKPSINTSGSGVAVSIGVEATINNSAFSIQEMNIYALLGRVI